MEANTYGLKLSKELMEWIEEDERISVDYDKENDVIITTFSRDRYIFENSNLSDLDYLKVLDVTKHNINEPIAKKNIKKIILEAQYFLETHIALHDMQSQDSSASKLVTAKIYRY